MRFVRALAGIFVGYTIFAVSAVLLFQISGRDPHADQDAIFEAFAIAYGMGFALIGGFVAAQIAGRGFLLYGVILAIIIFSGAFVSFVASPGQGAKWSQVSAMFLMAPCALLGGWLKARLARSR